VLSSFVVSLPTQKHDFWLFSVVAELTASSPVYVERSNKVSRTDFAAFVLFIASYLFMSFAACLRILSSIPRVSGLSADNSEEVH